MFLSRKIYPSASSINLASSLVFACVSFRSLIYTSLFAVAGSLTESANALIGSAVRSVAITSNTDKSFIKKCFFISVSLNVINISHLVSKIFKFKFQQFLRGGLYKITTRSYVKDLASMLLLVTNRKKNNVYRRIDRLDASGKR